MGRKSLQEPDFHEQIKSSTFSGKTSGRSLPAKHLAFQQLIKASEHVCSGEAFVDQNPYLTRGTLLPRCSGSKSDQCPICAASLHRDSEGSVELR